MSTPNKSRLRIGSILIYVLSLLLAGSAVAKLAQVPAVVSQMAAVGFSGNKLALIAALEIASAILFAVPSTRSFGILMVSAYLGGAIATHVGHSQPPFQPAVVLALFWFAAWFRHPDLFRSKVTSPS